MANLLRLPLPKIWCRTLSSTLKNGDQEEMVEKLSGGFVCFFAIHVANSTDQLQLQHLSVLKK